MSTTNSSEKQSPKNETILEFNLEKLNESKRKIEEYINAEYEKVVANHSELKQILANPTKKVKNQIQGGRRIQFNVGGKRYSTSFASVMSEPSILKKVCELDPEQPIFIDRDSECFDLILEYLRIGGVHEDVLGNVRQKTILLEEAEFYEIDGLVKLLSSKSTQNQNVQSEQKSSRTTRRKESQRLAERNAMTDGAKLMETFEEEIENSTSTLAKLFSSASMQTQEQTAKIKRFFGWEPVRIDVGGTVFEVPHETLSKLPNSVFVLEENDNSLFIDRSPDAFHLILRNIRGQTVYLAGLSKNVRDKYTNDLDFYGMKPLRQPQKEIVMSYFHNIVQVNDIFVVKSGMTQCFDKNVKSNAIMSGIHRLTFKLLGTSTKNVMFGVGGDISVTTVNLYNGEGIFFYTANNNFYGTTFGTKKNLTGNWGAIKVGDSVTLELDIGSSTVNIWLNNDVRTKQLICEKFPQLPAYHFYVCAYDPADTFSITNEYCD